MCAFPVVVNTKTKGYIQVPCGQCISCRIEYQRTLNFAVTNELQKQYRLKKGSSFVTLTYNDDQLPYLNTLKKEHLQRFMKRLRRRLEYHKVFNKDFKYIAVGEYGDQFGRPHYHVIFLGLSDNLINQHVRECWRYGMSDIGSLRDGGVRYLIGYCTKSVKGKKVI